MVQEAQSLQGITLGFPLQQSRGAAFTWGKMKVLGWSEEEPASCLCTTRERWRQAGQFTHFCLRILSQKMAASLPTHRRSATERENRLRNTRSATWWNASTQPNTCVFLDKESLSFSHTLCVPMIPLLKDWSTSLLCCQTLENCFLNFPSSAVYFNSILYYFFFFQEVHEGRW